MGVGWEKNLFTGEKRVDTSGGGGGGGGAQGSGRRVLWARHQGLPTDD